VLADPELAERMWKINDLYAATPVHIGELLSVVALDNLDPIKARAKKLLDTNRSRLNEFLNSRGYLSSVVPRYGTVAFPKLLGGNVDEFFEFLKGKYDTSIVPGRFFEMPQHFRVGIGGDPATTAEALLRLATALDVFSAVSSPR
jgi:aspartate/methionine/tyrosine aminotransferase